MRVKKAINLIVYCMQDFGADHFKRMMSFIIIHITFLISYPCIHGLGREVSMGLPQNSENVLS